jgi:hypothetical protein
VPTLLVMICRVCGSECGAHEILPVQEGGGCRRCNGSPACTRCGHPRRKHRGTFGGGEPGCKARVAAETGLAVGRCGCAGYTTESAAFTEATPTIEVTEIRLRGPDDAIHREAPLLAPVRDMLDEGRRSRDLSEPDRLPWRPPR